MKDKVIGVTARLMIAILFLLSAVGKLTAPAVAMRYMAEHSIPPLLVWPTIAFEIGAALALIVGFRLREVAFALAGFTLVAAVFFHRDLADKVQLTMMLKNIAIAGGLMLLAQSHSRISQAGK
jgi:putative oxidoreductase